MDDRIRDLSQRWIEGMSRRRKAARPSHPLAPWDELRYFDLPTITVVPVPNAPAFTQIVGANDRRVVLCFSTPVVGSYVLSPADLGSQTAGIVVQNSTLPLIFTQAAHGPLAQIAWFAQASVNNVNASIIEVFLREW